MKQIRTSARAILYQDGKLLVVRYQDDAGPWYVVPGGGQRHGEALTDALVREVAEETGLSVQVGGLQFVRECVASPGAIGLPPGFHQVEFFFACEIIGESDLQREWDPGQEGVERCSPDELRSRRFYPPALLDAIEEQREFGYLGVV